MSRAAFADLIQPPSLLTSTDMAYRSQRQPTRADDSPLNLVAGIEVQLRLRSLWQRPLAITAGEPVATEPRFARAADLRLTLHGTGPSERLGGTSREACGA